MLPDIAIGADVASGAFKEAQDERSSAQHNLAASETAEPSQHQAARPHTADAAGQRALQDEWTRTIADQTRALALELSGIWGARWLGSQDNTEFRLTADSDATTTGSSVVYSEADQK